LKILLFTILLLTSINCLALTNTQCKSLILFKEGNLESLKGQRAILDVVETRMRKENKSACQIMKQPSQFSWYNKKKHYVVDKDMVARYYQVNRMKPVFREAEFFHSVKIRPKWNYRKLVKLGRVGGHIFYRSKK